MNSLLLSNSIFNCDTRTDAQIILAIIILGVFSFAIGFALARLTEPKK